MGQDTQVCSQAMVNDNEGAQAAPVLSDRESEAEGLLGSVLPGTSHDPFFYSPPHATDDTALRVLLPRSLSNLCLSSVLPYSISTVFSGLLQNLRTGLFPPVLFLFQHSLHPAFKQSS